jgi:hypothetical protein
MPVQVKVNIERGSREYGIDPRADVMLGQGRSLGYVDPVLWAVVSQKERDRDDFQQLRTRVRRRRLRLCKRLAELMADDPVIQAILEEEQRDRTPRK